MEKELVATESTLVERLDPDTLFSLRPRGSTPCISQVTPKRGCCHNRQIIFAEGDKNGRAFLARTEMPQTVVPNIQSLNGDVLFNPKYICAGFMDYYAQLYKSRIHRLVEEISSFLDGVPLSLLSWGL